MPKINSKPASLSSQIPTALKQDSADWQGHCYHPEMGPPARPDSLVFADRYISKEEEKEFQRVGPPLLTVEIIKKQNGRLELLVPEISPSLKSNQRIDVDFKGINVLEYDRDSKEFPWNWSLTRESEEMQERAGKQIKLLLARFPKSKFVNSPDRIAESWSESKKDRENFEKKLAQNRYAPLQLEDEPS